MPHVVEIVNFRFGQAVNITVGLPILRTSVDHGTAYDIAGKGTADPSSLIHAIYIAREILKRRASGETP